jgi:hypothetical protein
MNEEITSISHTGEVTKKLTVRVSPALLDLIRERRETTRESQQDFVNRVLSGYCQQTAPATKQDTKGNAAQDAGKQDGNPLLANEGYDSVKAQFGG